jgi:hypothetical protein
VWRRIWDGQGGERVNGDAEACGPFSEAWKHARAVVDGVPSDSGVERDACALPVCDMQGSGVGMRFWEQLLVFSTLMVFVVLICTCAHCQAGKFWALTVATAGVTAVDGWQTARPGREFGTPWLYGSYPNDHRVRYSFTLGAEVVGSALAGRYLQRTRLHRLWWVPQSVVLQGHARGMIDNFRVGQY